MTQYLDGRRCLVANDFAESSQWTLHHALIDTQQEPSQLLALHVSIHESMLNEWLRHALDMGQEHNTFAIAQLSLTKKSGVWTSFCDQKDHNTLCVCWAKGYLHGPYLCLRAEQIYDFSPAAQSPQDRVNAVLNSMLADIPHAYAQNGEFHIHMLDFVLDLLLSKQPAIMPRYNSEGHLSVHIEDASLVVHYEAQTPQVDTCLDDGMPQWHHFSDATHSANAQALPHTAQLISKLKEAECSPADFEKAVDECTTHGSLCLVQSLLYHVTHSCEVLDPNIVLHVNKILQDHPQDLICLLIFRTLFTRNRSQTLLLDLYSRLLSIFTQCPHQLLLYSVEMAELLVQGFSLHSRAAQVLLAIKNNLHPLYSVHELVSLAWALHHAQRSNHAVQILRRRLNRCTIPQESSLLAFEIVRIMRDHNEPLQNIINMCRRGLSFDPHHLELWLVLAQSLELGLHAEAAAQAYETALQTLDERIQKAQIQKNTDTTTLQAQNNLTAMKLQAQSICMALEKLYQNLNLNEPRALILLRRLHIEPGNFALFSELLRKLELLKSYADMATICQQFLQRNESSLKAEDKISILLTIYRIFEYKQHRPQDALTYLNKARAINDRHPSVLQVEVTRAHRAGGLEDEITYRQLWIEQLQGQEAASQILELASIYEEKNNDSFNTLKWLRKGLAIDGQNIAILMAMRRNLRKSKQFYELVWVLEKLANLSNDTQKRRSFLLEASEVHAQQHNRLLAEKLYNEAQLCSPIIPTSSLLIPYSHLHTIAPPPLILLSDQNYLPTFDEDALTLAKPESHSSSSIKYSQQNTHSTSHSISYIIPTHTDSSTDNMQALYHSYEDHALHTSEVIHITANQNTIADEVTLARKEGDERRLFEKLKQLVQSLPENEQNPRMLQEIGCIALYDLNDKNEAKIFLEKASQMDENIANGEQTLNALEEIYEHEKDYEKLGAIYEKKYNILTIAHEQRKYEIRLAQLNFEHLNRTDLALQTVERLLAQNPQNETILSLLARIYTAEKRFDDALNTHLQLARLYPADSKSSINNRMAAIKILVRLQQWDKAKSALRELLESGKSIDRLGIIEQYKQLCRHTDDWEGLLEIFDSELSYYLAASTPISIQSLNAQQLKSLHSLSALHALREYADILFLKLNRHRQASSLYILLLQCNSDDHYAMNMLREIAETDKQGTVSIAFELQKFCDLPPFPTHEELEIAVSKSHNPYLKLYLALSLIAENRLESASRLICAVRELSALGQNKQDLLRIATQIETLLPPNVTQNP